MRFIRYYKYYACRSLAKLNLLQHLSFNLSQKFGAQKFRVPVIDGIGYHNLIPVREEWMDTIIQKLFSIRNGCVIDVGVNLGQTLLKIASFNTNINYYGFEPNPVCYAYCKQLNLLYAFMFLHNECRSNGRNHCSNHQVAEHRPHNKGW